SRDLDDAGAATQAIGALSREVYRYFEADPSGAAAPRIAEGDFGSYASPPVYGAVTYPTPAPPPPAATATAEQPTAGPTVPPKRSRTTPPTPVRAAAPTAVPAPPPAVAPAPTEAPRAAPPPSPTPKKKKKKN